jgi:transposase
LFSTVRTDIFSQVLADFAQAVGAGPTKQIVLVLDGAGWHTSKQLTIPEGVHLVFLPPYSPELQPAERLWTLTNEAIVNRLFATLDELEEVQGQRCVTLQANPDLIRRHTLFAWWPRLHPH